MTTGSYPGGGRPAPENSAHAAVPPTSDWQRPAIQNQQGESEIRPPTGEGRGGVTMRGQMAWKDQRLAELPPHFPGVLERRAEGWKGDDTLLALQAPLWLL